jgi:hypothetical protein
MISISRVLACSLVNARQPLAAAHQAPRAPGLLKIRDATHQEHGGQSVWFALGRRLRAESWGSARTTLIWQHPPLAKLYEVILPDTGCPVY